MSDDYGQTWRSIAAGVPDTSVHKLREHPRNARLLFVGHERGVSVSIDGGASWTSLNLNMPNVPVDDLLIHPRENDLIVGTHGRSIWILDNISALEALSTEPMTTDAFLVPPARARLLSIYNPQAWFGGGQFFAPNPSFGALLDYYVRDGVNGPAQISIADAGGSTVRTFKGPARRGINRVTWDLRLEPPVPAAEQPAAARFAGPPPGPTVLPGKYNVSVMLPSGRTLTGQLVVELDPRLHVADADRRVRQTSLLKLYELEKATAAARDAARGALDRATLARSASEGSALTRLQSDLTTMLNTAANLTRAIDGYSGAPTADQRRQIEWIFDDATKTIGELNRVLNADSRPPIVLPRRP